MSKSIHVTIKNFRNLTKEEINEQFLDPNSNLNKWSEKTEIKKKVKLERKKKRSEK